MPIPMLAMAGASAAAGLFSALFGGGNKKIDQRELDQFQRLYERAMGGDGDAMQALLQSVQQAQQNRWNEQTQAGDLGYSAPYAGGYWPGQVYTQQEQDAINDSGGLNGLMPSEDELRQMGYSNDEIQQIMGDPQGAFNYFNDRAMESSNDLGFTEQRLFDTLGEQGRNIRGGVADANARGTRVINEGRDSLRGIAADPNLHQREGYQSELNSIADDPSLGLDPTFAANYEFGDKDREGLEYLANRSAGARYDALGEKVRRQMAASGANNPLAFAGLMDQYNTQAAADAGDTAVSANLQGRREQLDRMKDKEGMRLGAAGDQARLRVGVRTQGEAQRLSSEQYIANLRKAIEEGSIDRELGLNAMVAELNQRGEEYLGSSQLDTIRRAGQARQDLQADVRNGGSRLMAQADRDASGRTTTVANNRTQVAQMIPQLRFNQGLALSNTRSGRASQIAGQRLGFEAERRGYNTGQINTSTGGMNTSTSNLGGFWTNRGQLAQGGANGYSNAARGQSTRPSTLERGLSTGLGVFNGLSRLGGGGSGSVRGGGSGRGGGDPTGWYGEGP